MIRKSLVACTILTYTALAGVVASAIQPAHRLLPKTAVSYLTVRDIEAFREHWKSTRLSGLAEEEAFKPFADNMIQQVSDRLNKTGIEIGLTLDDLSEVCSGEMCLATVQPGGDPSKHARVLIIDTRGNQDKAESLLEKVAEALFKQRAKQQKVTLSGQQATVFTLPRKRGQLRARQAAYCLTDEQLIAANDQQTLQGILARRVKPDNASLAHNKVFAKSMQECVRASGKSRPDILWFIDPLGYAEVNRAASGGRKRRGTDMLKVMRQEGFDAIEGIGGQLRFGGDHEIRHHTFVYADKSTFKMAARMLDFPNSDQLLPQNWIPSQLSNYVSFNWNMKEAFQYSKTLINAVAGDEIIEDILDSIKTDPQGPMIDIENDIIAHLGVRGTLIMDNVKPISVKSERSLLAIELTDASPVEKAVNQAMENDPDAVDRHFEEYIIWEIITEQPDAVAVASLEIDGVAVGDDHDDRILQSAAITVAHGHLIVASDVEMVKSTLRRMAAAQHADDLSNQSDFQRIEQELTDMGASAACVRIFTLTDKAYETTYELIRQGKMPEAQNVLGMLLNKVWGPDEEGVLRQQKIDPTDMPSFDVVREYLGPAGLFIHSSEDGWLISGCLLEKQTR